jgi:hypothetical protein
MYKNTAADARARERCIDYRHKGSTTSDNSESGRACKEIHVCVCLCVYVRACVCICTCVHVYVCVRASVQAININCWDRISLGKNLRVVFREHPMYILYVCIYITPLLLFIRYTSIIVVGLYLRVRLKSLRNLRSFVVFTVFLSVKKKKTNHVMVK